MAPKGTLVPDERVEKLERKVTPIWQSDQDDHVAMGGLGVSLCIGMRSCRKRRVQDLKNKRALGGNRLA